RRGTSGLGAMPRAKPRGCHDGGPRPSYPGTWLHARGSPAAGDSLWAPPRRGGERAQRLRGAECAGSAWASPLHYRTRAGEPSARAERSRSEPEPLRAMTKQTIRRALLYTRVSTQDQADHGYSLRDQEARLRAWCAREGVEVAGHYQDDHSAKTFERPAWTQLLARVEAGRVPDADAVLVVKWDRFSRDATGALSMIRRLEARGVAVQAVEQPIDRSVPEQLMMLAIYVAAPEVENRRRSLATKVGMRRAMREGRYMHAPPKGYAR